MPRRIPWRRSAPAGTYELLATITDSGGLSTTSSVTVVVDQTLTSISVSTHQRRRDDQRDSAVHRDRTRSIRTKDGRAADVRLVDDERGTRRFHRTIHRPRFDGCRYGHRLQRFGERIGGHHDRLQRYCRRIAEQRHRNHHQSLGTRRRDHRRHVYVVGYLRAHRRHRSNLQRQQFIGRPDHDRNIFDVGDYTFQVAIDNGTVTDETVAVTVVQVLASIVVTPGAVNLNENGQQQFTAAGYDQFGDTMSLQPTFAWVVSNGNGAIDGNGLYAAAGSGGTGPATITAISDGVFGDASIAVTNAAPTAAAPAVATPTPVTGTSTQLGVLGADDGGESNLVYTWSTTGSTPALVIFSANGDNASKNVTATFTAAGEYDFLVTIVDAEAASIASSVTVHVVPTLSTIAVTPADSSIERSASEQFSATGLDQFVPPSLHSPSSPGRRSTASARSTRTVFTLLRTRASAMPPSSREAKARAAARRWCSFS